MRQPVGRGACRLAGVHWPGVLMGAAGTRLGGLWGVEGGALQSRASASLSHACYCSASLPLHAYDVVPRSSFQYHGFHACLHHPLFPSTFLSSPHPLGPQQPRGAPGVSWEGRGSKARRRVKRVLRMGKKLQQKHGVLLYKGMPGWVGGGGSGRSGCGTEEPWRAVQGGARVGRGTGPGSGLKPGQDGYDQAVTWEGQECRPQRRPPSRNGLYS